ncbi:hypothetical protein WJ438_26645 [Streptomyces sp. GD-15H]|uniref:hypothetical protein n=1 Tax=Streptomyces sp. GD-15H TaxID=3129112 RepID=UPI00324A2066
MTVIVTVIGAWSAARACTGNRTPPAGVVVFMARGGSTMGEEPTWAELLLMFLLIGAVPTLVGGAVFLSLFGLTMWVTAPLRRRRRAAAEDG